MDIPDIPTPYVPTQERVSPLLPHTETHWALIYADSTQARNLGPVSEEHAREVSRSHAWWPHVLVSQTVTYGGWVQA